MNRFPTVILDECCEGLADQVRSLTSVYLFKRAAGYLSDPSVAAEQLHQMLLSLDPKASYIIVSPSFGAYTALLFANKYPNFVAGLVLLDPSHPRQGPVALEVLSAELASLSPSIAEFRARFYGFGPIWDEGCRQVSGIDSLGDIPLIILAAGRPEAPSDLPRDLYERLVKDRHLLLEDYARLSSRSQLRILPDAGHGIAVDAPKMVYDVISELL